MNIKIRPLEIKDAHISVHWRNNPEIWEYTQSRPDKRITIEDELDWIQKAIQDKKRRCFAIIADETYVGNIYLKNIRDEIWEYHVFIGETDYWAKGVAKEASQLLIEYAKREQGFRQIILSVRKNHERAIRLYGKLGFITYGTDGIFLLMRLEW